MSPLACKNATPLAASKAIFNRVVMGREFELNGNDLEHPINDKEVWLSHFSLRINQS